MSLLYFLEFFISELNLDEQIFKDAGKNVEFVVKVNVIDFPAFEITRQNLSSADVISSDELNTCLDFRAGQACHFTINPEKLVEKIQKIPLSIKIFRQGDSFPLCIAELPLSGCLCDQSKLPVDNFHIPKPYVFGGVTNLVDIGGNPSGNVNVILRITCCGKHVVTSYVLENDCFLFKNNPQGAEFRVKKRSNDVVVGEEHENQGAVNNTVQQFPWEDLTRDVAGIFPSAGRFSLGKPPPRLPRAPLIVVAAPMENKAIKKEKNKKKGKIKT